MGSPDLADDGRFFEVFPSVETLVQEERSLDGGIGWNGIDFYGNAHSGMRYDFCRDMTWQRPCRRLGRVPFKSRRLKLRR